MKNALTRTAWVLVVSSVLSINSFAKIPGRGRLVQIMNESRMEKCQAPLVEESFNESYVESPGRFENFESIQTPHEDFQLETERFNLKPLTESDLPELIPIMTNEKVAEMSGDHLSSDTVTYLIHSGIQKPSQFHQGQFVNFGIRDKATGKLIGMSQLAITSPEAAYDKGIAKQGEKWFEVSYHLDPAFWGKGVAPEVATRTIRQAFEKFGAQGIYGQTIHTNDASGKVLMKLGLKLIDERLFPTVGGMEGTKYYAMTKAEYEARAKSKDSKKAEPKTEPAPSKNDKPIDEPIADTNAVGRELDRKINIMKGSRFKPMEFGADLFGRLDGVKFEEIYEGTLADAEALLRGDGKFMEMLVLIHGKADGENDPGSVKIREIAKMVVDFGYKTKARDVVNVLLLPMDYWNMGKDALPKTTVSSGPSLQERLRMLDGSSYPRLEFGSLFKRIGGAKTQEFAERAREDVKELMLGNEKFMATLEALYGKADGEESPAMLKVDEIADAIIKNTNLKSGDIINALLLPVEYWSHGPRVLPTIKTADSAASSSTATLSERLAMLKNSKHERLQFLSFEELGRIKRQKGAHPNQVIQELADMLRSDPLFMQWLDKFHGGSEKKIQEIAKAVYENQGEKAGDIVNVLVLPVEYWSVGPRALR